MTKKIGYSKTYPILSIGVYEKIWIEEEVSAETDSRAVLYALKKTVESFHFEANKADEKKAEVKKDLEITPEGETYIGDQIKTCNELKILETYKFIIRGKPELEAIYNNRLKELT